MCSNSSMQWWYPCLDITTHQSVHPHPFKHPLIYQHTFDLLSNTFGVMVTFFIRHRHTSSIHNAACDGILQRWYYEKASREKIGYFTVRLTVSVYSPPRLQSAVCEIFGVFLNLDHDFACSDTDFTHFTFSSNYKNHHSSLLLPAALSQNGVKDMKNAFLIPLTMK